jgi:REP element-mobilizing transposase RayT
MAIPRRDIIDPTKPVVCHCVSRCVRRLFLLDDRPPPLGPDGKAPPPRDAEIDFWKKLLAVRIVQLVALFAIDVIEAAILSNHVHLLLATHPDLVTLWSDREIAVRWRTLTPDYHWRRRHKVPYDAPAQSEEIAAMLKDNEAIAHARRVLADVSQFHKFLKQRIAQLANAEDEVTGHFWDGRFKSIVATDAASVIAHMVYIALNPVRAGLADTLDESSFATIKARIDDLKRRIDEGEFAEEAEAAKEKLRGLKLLPALPCDSGEAVRALETLPGGQPNPWRDGRVPPVIEGLTVSAFLNEVDRVGRIEREGKASLSSERPTVMDSLERRLDARTSGAGAVARPPATRTRVADAVIGAAAAYAAPIEEAFSRGLANVIGNFSGSLQSVARRAAELGRKAVWAIFDPETLGPPRWVEAKGGVRDAAAARESAAR